MANKKPFYKKFRGTLYETVSDSGNSVLRYRGHDDKEHYVASSEDPDGGGNMPSGGGMVEVTWQELKDKRDNGELNPGALYRITDYNCTTTQENTRSAGHQFDIVLLALSENKLAEEGWAMEHPTDVYDVTFNDGVTKKCYKYNTLKIGEDLYFNLVDCESLKGIEDVTHDGEYIIVNEESKTITITTLSSDEIQELGVTYNYFQNSNLSAWKVWYCLDNDKSRFAWADDSVDESSPASITETAFPDVILYRTPSADTAEGNQTLVAWVGDNQGTLRTKYTLTETPNIGDPTYSSHGLEEVDDNVASYTPAHEGTNFPNGRGVIYRLIDEWNNDCPYDFKNIQTKLEEENDYEYTFYLGPLGEIIGIDPHTDISIPIVFETTFVSANNKVGYFINDTIGEGYNVGEFLIPFIHLESVAYYNTIGSHASQVKLSQCSINTIGDHAEYISLTNVRYSSFGHNCGHDGEIVISDKKNLNYGNGGVELATKS